MLIRSQDEKVLVEITGCIIEVSQIDDSYDKESDGMWTICISNGNDSRYLGAFDEEETAGDVLDDIYCAYASGARYYYIPGPNGVEGKAPKDWGKKITM